MSDQRANDNASTPKFKSPSDPRHKAGVVHTVGDREAVFIASTSAPDRYGDVVIQNWDFRDFRKNPVLLFQHDSSRLPIGRVKKVWSEGDATYARAEAPPEGMDGLADKVWRFIKAGFLNAVSVGFMPTEKPQERRGKNGEFLGFIYPKNSLLELSVVSVPANQEALAIARSLKLTSEETKQIFSAPAHESSGVSARVARARREVALKRLRVRN